MDPCINMLRVISCEFETSMPRVDRALCLCVVLMIFSMIRFCCDVK